MVQAENIYLFDETNNSVTNPATGTTATASSWTYDYATRTYTITATDGSTYTIVSGDDAAAVTIKDSGNISTTYNYYYGTTTGGGSSGGDSGTSWWEKILNKLSDGILAVFDLVGTIIGSIIGGLADLVTSTVSSLKSLVESMASGAILNQTNKRKDMQRTEQFSMADHLKTTLSDFFRQADLVLLSLCCTATVFGMEPGSLFIPWKGEKFDGHQFIDAALEGGAAGVLCAKLPANLRSDKFYIKVADTRLALKALAAAYRSRFDIPFVQVTGSVGKTTTKDMIASVLSARYRVLKTPENYNNDIGTPLTLLQLTPETEVAVIETGMRRRFRCAAAPWAIISGRRSFSAPSARCWRLSSSGVPFQIKHKGEEP